MEKHRKDQVPLKNIVDIRNYPCCLPIFRCHRAKHFVTLMQKYWIPFFREYVCIPGSSKCDKCVKFLPFGRFSLRKAAHFTHLEDLGLHIQYFLHQIKMCSMHFYAAFREVQTPLLWRLRMLVAKLSAY